MKSKSITRRGLWKEINFFWEFWVLLTEKYFEHLQKPEKKPQTFRKVSCSFSASVSHHPRVNYESLETCLHCIIKMKPHTKRTLSFVRASSGWKTIFFFFAVAVCVISKINLNVCFMEDQRWWVFICLALSLSLTLHSCFCLDAFSSYDRNLLKQ